jgi:hypothetical protein
MCTLVKKSNILESSGRPFWTSGFERSEKPTDWVWRTLHNTPITSFFWLPGQPQEFVSGVNSCIEFTGDGWAKHLIF